MVLVPFVQLILSLPRLQLCQGCCNYVTLENHQLLPMYILVYGKISLLFFKLVYTYYTRSFYVSLALFVGLTLHVLPLSNSTFILIHN